jgi:signal recognition particle subunit SRP54
MPKRADHDHARGLTRLGQNHDAGKLAYLHKNKLNKKVLLAGLDVYRPAAIEQLGQIAKQIDVDFFEMGTEVSPVEVAKESRRASNRGGYDLLILDTAGRLQIDEKLMDELKDINKAVHPEESASRRCDGGPRRGQRHQCLQSPICALTGVIMSKLDGDAKGGAALSIKYLTGLPIKFAGVGEKVTDLDIFYPDRMADRILGMGDVVSWSKKPKKSSMRKKPKRSEEDDGGRVHPRRYAQADEDGSEDGQSWARSPR